MFIYNKVSLDWGDVVHIMHKKGYGYVRAYNNYGEIKNHLFIDMLCVSNEHRKEGVGLSLLESAEEVGRNRECTHALLWVEIDSWMHKWYLRRGYKHYVEHESKKDTWLIKPLPPIQYSLMYAKNIKACVGATTNDIPEPGHRHIKITKEEFQSIDDQVDVDALFKKYEGD